MSEIKLLSWQKAVAELTAERGRAEAAARIIKRLGGSGDLNEAEIEYENGRAEAEAVIGALTVALEQGEGADDLENLQDRFAQAVSAREKLAKLAGDLAERAPGEKVAVLDLLAKALPNLLSAIGALWQRRDERDAAIRATIAARLKGTRWPAFANIAL